MNAENRYEPGQIVCYQGDEMRFLYILQSGAVEVFYNDPNDRPLTPEALDSRGQFLATIREPGQILGEMGAIFRTRAATLRASPEGAVLQPIPMPEGGIEKAVQGKPSLGIRIAKTLALRLRDCNRRLRDLGRLLDRIKDGTNRFARRFYEVSERLSGIYRGRSSMMNLVSTAQHSQTFRQGKAAPRIDPIAEGFGDLESKAAGEAGKGEDKVEGPTPVTPTLLALEPEAVLFERGEPGNAFYVVLEGQLLVELEDQELLSVEKGGIVGEMAILLEEETRTATVRATRKSRLLVVERDKFQEVVEASPRILLAMIRILAERLRNSNPFVHKNRLSMEKALGVLGEVAGDYEDFSKRLAAYKTGHVDMTEEIESLNAEFVSVRRFRDESAKGWQEMQNSWASA